MSTDTSLRSLTHSLVLSLILFSTPAFADGEKKMPEQFRELLTASQQEKFGLTFYLKGQTVSAIVTEFDEQVVEGRSQTHQRILIRAGRIDAVAR